MSDALVRNLREESRASSQVAWGRSDGGEDYAIASQLADAAADRIEEQAARIAAMTAERDAAISALAAEGRARGQAEAERDAAVEALKAIVGAVCGEDGFAACVRLDAGLAYPWPALDIAEGKARAILARIGNPVSPPAVPTP